jgi:hypothetical protein
LVVGLRAGLHPFDGGLYREFSATDILLGPGDLCSHVILVERRQLDVHAFCHSRSSSMSGAIPRLRAQMLLVQLRRRHSLSTILDPKAQPPGVATPAPDHQAPVNKTEYCWSKDGKKYERFEALEANLPYPSLALFNISASHLV